MLVFDHFSDLAPHVHACLQLTGHRIALLPISHAIPSQLSPPPIIFCCLSNDMSRSGPHRRDPPPFEPLPDNVFSRRTHPSWHDAYARCVGLFFWAVGRQPPAGTASYDMCSRVLGHLVLEAPADIGRDWLCRRILGCTDEHALARLAQKYIFTFVAACASFTSYRPRRRL